MKYILLLMAIGCGFCSAAQQPDLVFHHLTEKDGLSYNQVNCFLKDRQGMLWIGTYNGLSRYDGAHFFVFRKEKNGNSIPNNTVHKLAEDQQGNIWGATEEGIFCYNLQRNQFKNYLPPGEAGWRVALNIICDKQGAIWASDALGLLKFNSRADSFELAPVAPNTPAPPIKTRINKNGLAESTDGKGLWLASAAGLLYYDKGTRRYTSHKNSSNPALFSQKEASALCATGFGHFWYFDNAAKRLVGFDPVTQKLKYNIQNSDISELAYVATIFEDNNHLLWVCSWGYQVYTIDYLHGNVVNHVDNSQENPYTIAASFFWAAMQQNDGTIWLGTPGGISICNYNHAFYKVHAFAETLPANNGEVIEFLSENMQDSSWWVVTSNNQLIRYEPATGKTNVVDLNTIAPQRNNLRPSHVNAMVFTKARTWMFTDHGAWVKAGGGPFKPMLVMGLPADVVLKEGVAVNDSVMYITNGVLVWLYHFTSGAVTPVVYKKPFTISGRQPYTARLRTGKNGQVWMLNGLDWLSYTNNTALVPVKFSSFEKDGGTGYYTDMAVDGSGDVWVCKKGDGLFYYNTRENKYRQLKQYDGLIMDHIMAVAADGQGKIWAAAYNQFSVFNPRINSFYNFTLPFSTNNNTYTNLMMTLSNGHIIASIAGKLIEFFPERLKTFTGSTEPLISSVTIAGTEHRVPGVDRLQLAPHQNSLLVKFGLLADRDASPYDMFYLMEGAEKTWTLAGSNFEAAYNSLSPGHYFFKVMAVAKDKSWQTKEISLGIDIAAPFTKTWWFYGMVFLVIVLSIYAFYLYRIKQQQQVMQLEGKAQLLEKEKTLVLYESLKQQLNPHFLFNSLTSLSGLIETDQKMAGKFLDQMSKTYRYILKSSDNEMVPLRDEVSFVKHYIQLQQTRFKEGLQVQIEIPDDYLYSKIAPVTLQNMIENAIKHNIIDKEMPLVIHIGVEGDYLVIKNNLQKKNVVETSNKHGLQNLLSLYRYLTDQPIVITETDIEYRIQIPLI